MSIHQINKLFQNKGCNLIAAAILGVSVITMIGGVGFRGCGAEKDQQQDQGRPIETIANVGGFEITDTMVAEPNDATSITATDRFRKQGATLSQLVNAALALQLAKKEGVSFEPGRLKQDLIQARIEQAKQLLTTLGKLKPNATQQEFESVYKAQMKRDFGEDRKNLESEIDKRMATKEGLQLLEVENAYSMLLEKYQTRSNPTDAELKDQFSKYSFKLIPFGAGPDTRAKAEQALKDIKAGATFESQMEKYSTAKPSPGKKKSEQITDLTGRQISANPMMASLANLKPGEVSDILQDSTGAALYKLISKTPNVPKDFEAQKAGVGRELASQKASATLNEDLKKAYEAGSVKWLNEGYHALYDIMQLDNQVETPTGGRAGAAKAIIERALKLTGDVKTQDPAAAAAYIALGDLGISPETYQLRAEVLKSYVHQFPEVEAKANLVEALIQIKDAQNTAPALVDVAQSNAVHIDASGMATWVTINRLKEDALKKKLVKPEDAKAVEDAYKLWQDEYAQSKKLEKEQQEAQRKLDEENKRQAKALEEQDKKNKAGSATKPSPGNSGAPKSPGSKKPAGG